MHRVDQRKESYGVKATRTEKVDVQVDTYEIIQIINKGAVSTYNLVDAFEASFLLECNLPEGCYIREGNWVQYTPYSFAENVAHVREATPAEVDAYKSFEAFRHSLCALRLAGDKNGT